MLMNGIGYAFNVHWVVHVNMPLDLWIEVALLLAPEAYAILASDCTT